jgi:glutathione synthase/RimK-type ligase-like ATP-grasp enzyme
MQPSVLILTEVGDVHAYAVTLALQQRGVPVHLWHTSDFPTGATESILIERGREQIKLQGVGNQDLAHFSISRVWRRRPALAVGRERIHPSDRQFVEQECTIFRQALFTDLLPDAFWVNPHMAAVRASRKLVQQRTAVQVGFTTPDTLYSNDPKEIRDFLRRHAGQAIYKTYRPTSWRDAETYWVPYSSLINEADLVEDELLQAVPGIFQTFVPKQYELRVTVMGRRIFATKLDSQQTTAGKIDWRKAHGDLRMEPYLLPSAISANCIRLLQELGLVFGCFDLVVNPGGEYVFLEVNEGGQFLFVEHFTGQPLLDAFCEFLTQGDVDFAWDASHVRSRYRDLEAEALALAKRARAEHVAVPDQSIAEEVSAAATKASGG